VVFMVSNAVAAQVGIAPALCVPLVALLLVAIVRVGVAAWCQLDARPDAAPPVGPSEPKKDQGS
jgi:hypothetical protein